MQSILVCLRVIHQALILKVKQTSLGLAVDWVAANLYWTDSFFKHVMLSRDDGRFQRELITNNLDHPRGIAVDAVNRCVIPSFETTMSITLTIANSSIVYIHLCIFAEKYTGQMLGNNQE